MNAALSIAAAARESPHRLALIFGEEHLRYEDLAKRCADMTLGETNICRADSALDTALHLYASLERRRQLKILPSQGRDENKVRMSRSDDFAAYRPAQHLALRLSTSGSSGARKEVLLSRRALRESARAANVALSFGPDFGPDARWLCCLPLSHIGGLSILIRSLVARATVVLCEGFEAGAVASAVARHSATHVSLVPTMLWRLLEIGATAPPTLRETLIGGAALDPQLAERAQRAGFALRLSYGMTETSSMVICDGQPLAGVNVRLGPANRLEIRAPMLMDGYAAEEGCAASVDCSSILTRGWLATEDRARIGEGGCVHILGRMDRIIISGGENIDLDEVETKILAHPQVRECMALGVDDAEWGQKLVVLIVGNALLRTEEFPELLGHKRPKALIPVDTIPLLENGKPNHMAAQKISALFGVS